jgi:photosystem II stability/assembly factor-like uncharacterized protein
MNLKNGEVKGLRPTPAEGQAGFRFNWNAPFIASRHEKGVMYLGGNRVFRLTNHGEEWKPISPDLSKAEPGKIDTTGSGAETYAVVYALADSPVKPGMLWAGTDDGKLWVTEDEGQHWTDLTANLPEPGRGQWVSRIEPSYADAKTAYVAIDAHRAGIYAPLLYVTRDGGKTWASIAGNIPGDEPVKVLREDSKNPNLLFAGTEFGLYMSPDAGATWQKFGGLPTVAVDDIQIHPRERDVVVATHGRSLYVIDDITPLEQWKGDSAAKEAIFFDPMPAWGRYELQGFSTWGGHQEFRGENPPRGAVLSYWVREYTGDPVRISITDAANQPVANLSAPGVPGFGRVVWDLRMSRDMLSSYGGEGQKFVRSGEYTVTLSYGKVKEIHKLQVTIAPGIETR